jgi:ribonuclease E
MFVPEDGQTAAVQGEEGNETRNGNGNNGEPREKRSRDRYGRDRGPRTERPQRHEFTENSVTEVAAGETVPMAAQAPVVVQLAPQQAFTPAAVVSEPLAATPAAVGSMPKVSGYALPQDDLIQVAQGSGLQWVNTNAESVAKVQAAIAAEAQTVHVPRPRPAPVSIDAGPLVLVETKRDLRNMTLPFEESNAS